MAQTIASGPMSLPRRHGGQITRLREGAGMWLFLLPAVAFFVGYQVWPIIRVLWMSFTDYQFLTNEPAKWVWFDNYIQALEDPLMWASLWRAALFTIMFLPGTIILPLLLAILIDRVTSKRLATLYRVVLLIPAVIPSTLIFVLWKWMYNYQAGPINHFLVSTTGLFTLQNAPQWLGGTPLTLPSIAVMEVWWGLGYHTIFFLAGLAAIPKDLPEAARIDGANQWQVLRHVYVPGLRRVMEIVLVTSTITVFVWMFVYIFTITNGGPGFSIYVVEFVIYNNAFSFQRMGYVCVIGFVLILVISVLGFIQIRIFIRGSE